MIDDEVQALVREFLASCTGGLLAYAGQVGVTSDVISCVRGLGVLNMQPWDLQLLSWSIESLAMFALAWLEQGR
jgi:hypothetical protein